MTLTNAQAVAIDALREAFDETTVERALAALRGEAWVVERHYDYEGETLLGVRMTEAEALAFARSEHIKGKYDDQPMEPEWWEVKTYANGLPRPAGATYFCATSGNGELWLTKMPLVS